jgi:hypothetical protein
LPPDRHKEEETMNENPQGHHLKGDSAHDGLHTDHRPYWKHAHQDWRVWVAVFVMIAGMAIYVMSDDFAFLPRSRTLPAQSGALGR